MNKEKLYPKYLKRTKKFLKSMTLTERSLNVFSALQWHNVALFMCLAAIRSCSDILHATDFVKLWKPNLTTCTLQVSKEFIHELRRYWPLKKL